MRHLEWRRVGGGQDFNPDVGCWASANLFQRFLLWELLTSNQIRFRFFFLFRTIIWDNPESEKPSRVFDKKSFSWTQLVQQGWSLSLTCSVPSEICSSTVRLPPCFSPGPLYGGGGCSCSKSSLSCPKATWTQKSYLFPVNFTNGMFSSLLWLVPAFSLFVSHSDSFPVSPRFLLFLQSLAMFTWIKVIGLNGHLQ